MHHSIKTLLLTCVVLLLLGGCSDVIDIEALVPEQEKNLALEYSDAFRAGNYEKVSELSHPELQKVLRPEKFQAIVDIFATGMPESNKVMGFNQHTANGKTQTRITLLTTIAEHQYFTEVKMIKEAEKPWLVFSFYVQPDVQIRKQQLAAENIELTPSKVLLLTLTIAIGLFSLGTFVMVIFTPFKKKVRWCLMSLVGIGQVTMDLASGAIDFSAIQVHLFGFELSRASEYEPYILSFSLPLGALAFWLKRKQLIAEAQAVQAEATVAANQATEAVAAADNDDKNEPKSS